MLLNARHATASRPAADRPGREFVLHRGGACLAILLLSFFLAPAGPASAARPGVPVAALEASAEWLGLLDAGKYNESWTRAGSDFRQSLDKADWARRMAAARKALGANTSRKPIDARQAEPGGAAGAAGECMVILFGAGYEKVSYTTETLTLCREGGQWRVAGYFIR